MEGRRKIRRGQFGQRKAPSLASEPCHGMTGHRDGASVVEWTGFLVGGSFLGIQKAAVGPVTGGHVE